jgi:hypothetical protein
MFIDYIKAFDRVKRRVLWAILEEEVRTSFNKSLETQIYAFSHLLTQRKKLYYSRS